MLEYSRQEALNTLYTNLNLSTSNLNTICVTSTNENEGKSFVSMYLMRLFAEDGKKILLLDADMRKSRLARKYDIRSREEFCGLTHYLAGQKSISDIIYNTDIPNADMILAGNAPNPVQLLNGQRFGKLMSSLKETYDMVLIDTAPIGIVIDSAIIAKECDGILFILSYGATGLAEAQEAKRQLEMTGTPILGAVLNQVPYKVNSGYYY